MGLISTQVVLHRYKGRTYSASEHLLWSPSLVLDGPTFQDMNEPELITVTIESGNTIARPS
jgi:hypothetical protein